VALAFVSYQLSVLGYPVPGRPEPDHVLRADLAEDFMKDKKISVSKLRSSH
jgi:hypothetical protein